MLSRVTMHSYGRAARGASVFVSQSPFQDGFKDRTRLIGSWVHQGDVDALEHNVLQA